MKKIIFSILIFFFLIFGASCSNKESYDIMTSCYPVYEFTTRIVGDKYTVKNLVKPGIEPHEYEPSTKDVRNLIDCKLFIVNGLGLEHYTNDLTKDIKQKMFMSTSNIELLYEDNTVDPHIWLDPKNAITMMSNIKDKIIELDPENKDYYINNFNTNKELFLALDNKYNEELTNLSSSYLITSHKAFGYLCKAYGLTQVAINGLSTEDEPTAEAIASLIDRIKDMGATTIFYEELVSDSIAKSIASETGLKCDVLNPIEGISNKEDNYITIMEKNLEAIKRALL